MQIFPRLSNLLRNKAGIGHVNPPSSARIMSGDASSRLERELYGMDAQEQAVVRRIISMAGQAVPVRQDTVAIDRKYKPRYLEQGRQVRIAENPFYMDSRGGARIIVSDENNQQLFIKLSDYLQDIHAADQG